MRKERIPMQRRKYIKAIAAVTAVCVLCAGCGNYTTLPAEKELPVKTTRTASTADDSPVATSTTKVATQTTVATSTTTTAATTTTTEQTTTTTETTGTTAETINTNPDFPEPEYAPVPFVPEENLVVNEPVQEDEVITVYPVLDGEVTVRNLQVSTISVSCLKLTWDADAGRDYFVYVETDAGYAENMAFCFKGNSVCYITGLRENAEYSITVTPEEMQCEYEQGSTAQMIESEPVYGHTEAVEIVWTYPKEDGWTNCFTFENAKGLTANPSYSAIYGAEPDVVTNTGIMRDEYGDYCVAMGTWYGYCWDRFLVTLENGIQFTVKICDSKGDRRYHTYAGVGKSVIEFIHADGYLPEEAHFTGNYGYFDWSGLNLTANIDCIQMINYGDPISY